MTEAEKRLWTALRGQRFEGFRFRRQVPLGPYVADFVCHEARLVVAVDGPSHLEPGAAERDAMRTAFIESEGYRVLRVLNSDVYESLEGVLVQIGRYLPGFETDLDRERGPPGRRSERTSAPGFRQAR